MGFPTHVQRYAEKQLGALAPSFRDGKVLLAAFSHSGKFAEAGFWIEGESILKTESALTQATQTTYHVPFSNCANIK